MTRRILIGYENGEHGGGALELGCRLAGALGGEAVVAHVYVSAANAPVQPDTNTYEVWHEMLQREADELVGQAVSRCPPEASARGMSWASTSPARGLYELAEREQADLVVVGSTHRGVVGRVLIGSTAERLLHGVPCPVLVAPHSYANAGPARGFATIGVAFDAGSESEAALEFAGGLAAELGSQLRLICVLEPPSFAGATGSAFGPSSGDYNILAEAIAADARLKLEQRLASLEADFEAEGELLTGDAADLLAAESGRGLELLVVGSRGYGPLRRVLLGSVSAALARTSACPVAVVPRSGTEAPPMPSPETAVRVG